MKDFKENKNSNPKTEIELYNRDITDILGDIPKWLVSSGSYILYGLIIILLLGSSFINYPDITKGSIIIEDTENVNWITSYSYGKINNFLVENNSFIKKGDTIALIQNPANFNDVKKLIDILGSVEQYYLTNDTELLRKFPFDLVMGEMSDAYIALTQSVRNCVIYDDYNYYSIRKTFLQKEKQILINNQSDNEIDILRLDREIFELGVNHQKEVEYNKKQLELAYENIVNSIKKWETNYIIKSSNEGKIILGETRDLTHVVNIGDTICTVISNNKENFIGRIYLSPENVAGIKQGNIVNIKLAKYPSHTYGVLIGKVDDITFVPFYRLYSVEIVFPDNLITSTKNNIQYELGLKGEAEIIKSNRSVLSRIFDPLFNIINNNSKG